MFQLPIITERFILREITAEDADGLFQLDSDPKVHEFLEVKELQEKEEVYPIIESIRSQYKENGIGRWAIIEKESGEFMGWSGLKLESMLTNGHQNYYDLGYRLIPKFWGKGYATESSLIAVSYGFNILGVEKICGAAHCRNTASNKVLQKAGLRFVEEFNYEGEPHNWYELLKEEWKEGLIKRTKR